MKDKELTHLGKDALITLVLAGVAVLASIGAGLIVISPGPHKVGQIEKQPRDTVEMIADRELIDFTTTEEENESVTYYSYKGEALPEKLAEDEVLTLRTTNSYTRKIGMRPDGAPILSTVFYPQDSYAEIDGTWYYVEYGSAKTSDFQKVHHPDLFSLFKARVVRAASIAPFSLAGDGYFYHYVQNAFCTSGGSFNTAHSDTSSTPNGSTNPTTGSTGIRAGSYNICTTVGKDIVDQGDVYRGFVPFTTSSIPAGSTITSAVLSLYANSVTNTAGGSYNYVVAVQTSQASTATLVDADYDNVSFTEGSNQLSLASITTSAYNNLTLDSTGRGWVKTAGQSSNCGGGTGVTCLGVLIGDDTQNVAPPDTGGGYSLASFSASETAGTTQDPYLTVVYSPPFAFWQFEPF